MPPFGNAQLKLLEKLCNVIAVSGDEGEVRKIVLDEIKPYTDEIKVDAIGNVLAIKHGRGAKRLKVMLDAHMDEVGFMIVAEDGVPVGDLRIDLGLTGKAKVGDRAGFATQFRRVGPSIMSKSIDDRIGVATVVELLKHAPAHLDICAAFTVQEEIGLRGAKVAAQYFNPDLAIAIDSTPANDLPAHEGDENISYNTRLGFGPAIYLADGSTLHDPRLIRFLSEVGDAENIPYQFRQPGGGGTDSGAIQLALAGIPTVSVSVPHRYTHSPISISRVDDWKNTINLLHATLKKITPSLIKTR